MAKKREEVELLRKAVEGLKRKHRSSEAIIMAILEQAGPVKVKRERLNEIVNGVQEAVVAYDAEADEYTFAPAAE